MTLQQWAQRWGLTPQAAAELQAVLAAPAAFTPPPGAEGSEAGAQQKVRLAAPLLQALLWRNNSGAFEDEHGNFIRFGLCNDSKRVNDKVKSSDLIGITPVQGRGVFTAIEMKAPGWKYKGTKKEKAQLQFLNIVQACGGIATFATGPEDYMNAVEAYTNGSIKP